MFSQYYISWEVVAFSQHFDEDMQRTILLRIAVKKCVNSRGRRCWLVPSVHTKFPPTERGEGIQRAAGIIFIKQSLEKWVTRREKSIRNFIKSNRNQILFTFFHFIHEQEYFWNVIKSNRNQIVFTIFNFLHTEKSFRNLIKSIRNQIVFTIFYFLHRNFFGTLLNQPEIRLHF